MWQVYILRCSDKSFYTGIATDALERLEEHNSGHGSKYVRSRRPAEIVWSMHFIPNRSKAQKLEQKIKRLSHEVKEKLIYGRISYAEALGNGASYWMGG